MSYNGKLLSRARASLETVHEANLAEQQRRTAQIYAALPKVRAIDEALRAQMVELMGLAIRHGGSPAAEIAALEKQNLSLQSYRAELLAERGFPINYTDEIYSCPKCRDTGMLGITPCDCLIKLYNLELTKELGALLRCGDESFEKFDLSLYDGSPDPRTGLVPRDCMELVLRTCLKYAERFRPGSPNLLFRGGTGLGKTYLSACIARKVSERGFSVAYDSAGAALEAFETQKFSRDTAVAEAAAARTRQFLACDLMILDDLGTEMVTSFSVSALYSIINSRLIGGKSTVISTNCTAEELSRKYSQQIISRLDGEYTLIPFVGRDIRLIKKERGL
ncbi:MAG: ATP-binding protein [Oscillospiraceae bacterium]